LASKIQISESKGHESLGLIREKRACDYTYFNFTH
jgi:hypothetical protein